MKLHKPTRELLKRLDALDQSFNSQIAASINEVYNVHGWTKDDLHALIPGIEPEQWRRYAQQSYTRMRPAHVVGALSWISQVSMTAILRGKKVAHFWNDAPQNSIYVIARCGMMDGKNFEFYIHSVLKHHPITECEKKTIFSLLDKIECPYDAEYFAPLQLDIEAFAEDYYTSSAIAIREVRIAYNLTMSNVAEVLGVTTATYRRLEDIHEPKRYIDSLLAFRFKNAFQIEDTTGMLAYMEKFSGFYNARKIQEAREQILKPLLVGQDVEYANYLATLAENILKCQKAVEGSRYARSKDKSAALCLKK